MLEEQNQLQRNPDTNGTSLICGEVKMQRLESETDRNKQILSCNHFKRILKSFPKSFGLFSLAHLPDKMYLVLTHTGEACQSG